VLHAVSAAEGDGGFVEGDDGQLEAPACRICHEGPLPELGALFAPCRCRG
jgi:hypothetical protein